MAESVAVVIARAKLAGRILLNADHEETIQVPAGKPLRVEYHFNYVDVSRKRDAFHLELSSKLGKHQPVPATYSHGDRQQSSENHEGLLHHEYPALTKGTHKLTYQASAEYMENGKAWQDHLDGALTIDVV